ncbi:MAG TPA: hypothetical protein VFA55_02855, partial [Candidatus Kapabacteria bacterium]|nr:hypothetical protein [Candidatus Kapabacteria bacterium]
MKRILFIILLLLFPAILAAQDKQTQDDKNVLELPEFIIKGSGTLDIKAVRKETPRNGWNLDSASLATLHPVVGAPLPAQAADSIRTEKVITGNHLLIHAQMGLYNTPDGWLQYQTTFAPFDLYVRGEGFSTNGSTAGVAYRTADPSVNAFGVNGGAGWRVPDNVLYFGNARVGVDVDLHSTTYNVLYGDSIASQLQSQRQTRDGGMAVGMAQDAGPMQFNVQFLSRGYKVQDATSNSDNLFGMRGGISFIGTNWMVKGGVQFNTYTTTAAGRNFSEVHFEAQRLTGAFRYALGGSLFSAQNNIYDAETFIAPLASMQYTLSHSTELFAAFAPRMHDETMQAILATNPYVNLSALDSIRYPYEPVNIAVGVRSNGETPFNAEVRLSYIRTNNDRIFRLIGSNEWVLDYDNTSTAKASVQGSWQIAPQDVATAILTAQSSMVNSSGDRVPYVPAVAANIGYSHIFVFPLTVSVDADILGPRNATLDGSQSLSAVALVNAQAEYKL